MADVTWVVVDTNNVETMVEDEKEAKARVVCGGHYGVIVHANGHYVRCSPKPRDYAAEKSHATVKWLFDSIIDFSYGSDANK